MANENKCPKCNSEHVYADGNMWMCPECFHEWSMHASDNPETVEEASDNLVRDANGNVLQDGDSVTLIKELRLKGSSSAIKVGTKVKSIRLIEPEDGHNIACKIDGFGAINLKSEFVRKA